MNRFATLLTTVIFAALRFPAFADDAAEAGRRVLSKNQDAVVTVKLVVAYSVSYSGRDQQSESKTEAVGTVIDPSGLTVISLTAIDPSAMMKARMRNAQADLKIESEVKDTKIVLGDGTEIPAEIALRDKDLDVVFLRPTDKSAKPFAAIDLTKASKPQVLDQVICLNRLGKVANRVATVSIERVDALIERPRPFYVLGVGGSSGVGSPVFALSGASLGIMLIRNAPTDGEANLASMFSGPGGGLGILPVIVPAADLVEDAKQAMEAKKPASTEQK
jgi:hypothetical protein